MSILTRHLQDVDETYAQHLRHAIGFALAMFGGAIACFIHALMPFLFEKTGSRCITRLHERMLVKRKNLTPAEQKPSKLQTASR